MDKDHGRGAAQPILYHGDTSKGAFKIRIGSLRCHYAGVRALLSFNDGNWSTRRGGFNPLEAGVANGTSKSADNEVFVAQHAVTKKLWLIQGRLLCTFPVKAKKAARKPMPLAEYQDEMKRIKVVRDNGGDPEVSVEFITRHANRSYATVYRDVKAGVLERPGKCGNSSRWPFSAVDAYARGVRPDAGA